MALRNVHKDELKVIGLPEDAISEDRGLRNCGVPQLVLASLTDAAYYKNDRTSLAYKFDEMTVELEKDGVTIPAPGVAITFPYQSDAVGFCIDWRQVTDDGVLMQGCYRVKVTWSLDGNEGFFYYGSFNLLEYSVFNAHGTVRLFVVLNDLVRKQGINFKDSGFATTIRFIGTFGNMQPNYDIENINYTDRTKRKVRIEALRTYELISSMLLYCMTRQLDEEILLAANQIYVTDHNADNHRQDFFDFPVILSEDESPSIEYTGTIYAKVKAVFNDKVQVSESKYDGNIQGSDNVVLSLPTVVSTTEPCAPVDVYVGEANVGSFASGTDVFVTVTQDGFEAIPEDVIVTGNDINIVLADTPDTTIEVNGTTEGTFTAGSTIDVQLSDSGGVVTPTSVTVVGNDVQVLLPDAPPVELDAVTVAFMNATAINDTTIENAIDNFVKTLRYYDLWGKFYAIYPYVGGTATTHKYNLVMPLDVNNAFRLTFSGGITHDANGITFNGVNGFATSNFFNQGGSNYGVGFYSRTNNTNSGTDFYADAGLHIYPNFSGSTYHRGIGASPDNYVNGNTAGLFHQYGKPSASSAFLNDIKKLTGGTGSPSGAVYTFGSGAAPSNRNHSFAFISVALTDAEAQNLYIAVQTLQTALSRNV